MATGNAELDDFKTQINLCQYAASLGFVLDRKQSSKSSAVMRHSNGDKIVVAKKSNRHWIYFNVHGNDNGTIIDFVAARLSLSIGQARRELRPWIGGGGVEVIRHEIKERAFELSSVKADMLKVTRQWVKSRSIQSTDLYLASREIPEEVLADPIFLDRIRIDGRHNTIFPHWNASAQLCGFEIKNNGFTGFSPGGEKGLWCSRPRSSDKIMVLCESAIDALSVATIFGTDSKRFFSTAGKCNPNQIACLISAAGQLPIRSEIWLAFDNDEGGQQMAADIRREFIKSLGDSFRVVDKMPKQVKSDWNDVLRSNTEGAMKMSLQDAFRI